MTVVQEWVVAIAAALARDKEVTLKGYCGYDGCPTRDVVLHVKDYDSNLLAFVGQQGVRCPLCRRCLELRSVTPSIDERDVGGRTAAQLLEGDR